MNRIATSNRHYCERPQAAGKFLLAGGRKFYVRGVTYGPFRPHGGSEFCQKQSDIDLTEMAACGINAVRTYVVPPRWFLDAALARGLRVMVGIAWEQHVALLDDSARAESIEERVREAVGCCAGHPGVLCYAIGNEIPSSIVRWHGARRTEAFLARLYRAAKLGDPEGLVTYVNYPSTEYLDLSFLDLVCFNVYLESQERWESYLARLQNLAGDRPLILAEVGLDSRRHGEEKQARTLDWLIRSSFARGCAGSFVFAWTDEWYRGGYDINDWDFGLTRRNRTPKPALEAVRRAFVEAPFPLAGNWPRVSVIVCTYNGHNPIRDTLEGLRNLRYPNFEVIIVDDGSSPPIERMVAPYGFQIIRTRNQGLSAARNVGIEAATGEIIAYLDDDAYPDPDWLSYLADAFAKSTHVGVGGPNIPPPGDGRIAYCVANAPGGPIHVLLSDELAEHIPGCNMAFRREALQAVGGFDPRFRVAGDDVDLCWRLQERGGTLGFCPGAMVWHHRRKSIRAYWKQQVGYGRAEALLAEKWPEKYNRAGHLSWAGRIYGRGVVRPLGQVYRIYHGTWGAAPFQRLYQSRPNGLLSVLLMPEWYLILFVLGLFAALGHHYGRFQIAGLVFLLAVTIPVLQAWRSSRGATVSTPPRSQINCAGFRVCTAFLYLLQPFARLWGRLRYGIAPWRKRGQGFCLPRARSYDIWTETWRAPEQWLERLEKTIRSAGAASLRGGAFDPWDLEVAGGLLGCCRVLMAVEEHGAGRQLFRFRAWPHHGILVLFAILILAVASAGAALSHAEIACGLLALSTVFVGSVAVQQYGAAMAAVDRAIRQFKTVQPTPEPDSDILRTVRASRLEHVR